MGARGTICGLANVMSRLLRAMFILCRGPFNPSVKALLADTEGDAVWCRVVPPMAEPPMIEGRRLVQDFRRWEAALPPSWRSLYGDEEAASPNIVALRRQGLNSFDECNRWET